MRRPHHAWLVVVAQLVSLGIAWAAVRLGVPRLTVFDAWAVAQVLCLSVIWRGLWRSL